jgi:hypothetical protein
MVGLARRGPLAVTAINFLVKLILRRCEKLELQIYLPKKAEMIMK